MADPFVAEIRIFPFNFAPNNWAWCNGQLIPITQNTALYALLGTYYGGDGKSNFALPDLMGRAPMHPGHGSGLSLHDLGETGGSETVTLLQSEIPAHSHSLRAVSDDNGVSDSPQNSLPARAKIYSASSSGHTMAPQALTPVGGNQPHNNMMPYLTFYFNIALTGVFPPRG
jgi:microcystin-dependent protein